MIPIATALKVVGGLLVQVSCEAFASMKKTKAACLAKSGTLYEPRHKEVLPVSKDRGVGFKIQDVVAWGRLRRPESLR